VMGVHTVMFAGSAPFGALILGAVARSFGPQTALVVSCGAALAGAVWLATKLPAPLLQNEPSPFPHRAEAGTQN